MELTERFKRFEKMLSNFSIKEQQNYYKNKKSLIIEYDPNLDSDGEYLCKENKIILKNEAALEHELAHMAFNDRESYDTEIVTGYFKGNGIAYKDKDKTLNGIGITEGFAENLSQKATNKPTNSYGFEAYIVKLLLLIRGEKLYHDLLTNNPYHFYNNNLNESVLSIISNLDFYYFALSAIIFDFQILYKDHLENKKEDLSFDSNLVKNYIESIIESITAIIDEYNSCSNPKTTQQELKIEIEKYFNTVNFLLDSRLSNLIGGNLKQEIDIIINEQLMSKKYIK